MKSTGMNQPYLAELDTTDFQQATSLWFMSAASPAPFHVPAAAAASFYEGLAHLQYGEGKKAVEALSISVQAAPGYAPAHAFLGVAHAATQSVYPAMDHLEIATQLDPNGFASHYLLAQLYFKLRVPQKGCEEARAALRCAATYEHRKMLTQLLKEERERERHGIKRTCFNKPFSASAFYVAGSGLAGLMIALGIHLR
ncbi:MAG TPA: hypothetical protein VG892_03845 [Terriglobales bacterium]|nr:hypothetical protein [Terriglobales bacterium]